MAEKNVQHNPTGPTLVQTKVSANAQPPPSPQAFDLLLKIEADARRCETVGELVFLIANDTLRLTRARQIFVFASKGASQRVEAVSSIGKVERDSPRIRWIEAITQALATDAGLEGKREFVLPAYCPPGDEEHKTYPYRFLLWLPFRLRNGRVFGGMLLAREVPWNEGDLVVAARLADTYAHAWVALTGERRLRRRSSIKPWLAVAALMFVAAGFIPVPLTVLAPAEVAPVEPRVVAAPLDGVVDTIAVDPNANVQQGQLLFGMSDTALRNELAVAEQDVMVAEAKLKQVSQAAIADPKSRGDLAVTRTELSLATAKRDYASDLLERSRVTAPISGVAIFTDKRDWIGRPVTTGERIMEIADPNKVQIRIDVPVADAVAVTSGAKVRAFLDSDPLRPLTAHVRTASYEAQLIEGNVLAYRIYATIEEKPDNLRLGIRGTAQVSGDKVPLAYYLFRRPIAAIRQRLGL
ncbi:efflux RND transporter periplasmic adaptor subunit [Mesorhizobium amorphae]|uniref:efflux RND transporter periplasmic adaptor subunit n=1 Tax=Mesorhizobium amorphae TaxID=71433 RepID=UPI0011832EB6|nr:HlyD family efflux transporter periplasmic adaptor subunit [Mesorhizobium amorphae]